MLASMLGGCAPGLTVESLPPCAILVVEAAGDSGFEGRGQGLWIGNRVLTMAHLFTVKDAFPPTAIYLNGDYTPVVAWRSGDPVMVKRLYSREDTMDAAAWVHDWCGLEVLRAAPTLARGMRLSAAAPRPGERLYAVGYDPSRDGGPPRCVPLVVQRGARHAGTGERAPDDIVTVKGPPSLPRGWSGAFVGRYDAEAREWEYVGQLVAGWIGETGEVVGLAVLRPPPEALEWLMEGGQPLGECHAACSN